MREKLIKLLNLTASSNDNEALVSVRMANQILKKNGVTWNQIFETINIEDDEREIAMGQVMPFGKYKGYSVGEIYKFDMGYLEWCLANIELRPHLEDAIELVLR